MIANHSDGVVPMRVLNEFLSNHSGATATEYGLIVAGISLTLAFALQSVGLGLNATFNALVADLSTAQ
jgi:Flp pilus assembly pilin Flp